MVDPRFGRQLAYIGANAAPGAGVHLKIAITVIPFGGFHPPMPEENHHRLGKDVHIPREREGQKETTQYDGIGPPGGKQ